LPIRLGRPVIACIPGLDSKNLNYLDLIPFCLSRAARWRFAEGSSGNPRGRPPGIPNPSRMVPDLAARPLSAQALLDLLDRKPQLLRPLAEQLLPPPLVRIDPAARLGIDLSSLRTVEDFHRCYPPCWRPLRAATSRPPRARILQSGRMRLRVAGRRTRRAESADRNHHPTPRPQPGRDLGVV
jgi:hypothetical protein